MFVLLSAQLIYFRNIDRLIAVVCFMEWYICVFHIIYSLYRLIRQIALPPFNSLLDTTFWKIKHRKQITSLLARHRNKSSSKYQCKSGFRAVETDSSAIPFDKTSFSKAACSLVLPQTQTVQHLLRQEMFLSK